MAQDTPCAGPSDECSEEESTDQTRSACTATLSCHVQESAEICTNQEVFVMSLYADDKIIFDILSQESEDSMASRVFVARALEESARMRRETGKM